MKTALIPYLRFKDNTREAMEFYHSVFGGNVQLTTFKEGGIPNEDEANKIMHAVIEADNGITFMGADTPNSMEYNPGSSVTMSLGGDNEEELRAYFEKLSDGGTVQEPLEKAPWGDTFGMLIDKFGIEWMVNISATQPQIQDNNS